MLETALANTNLASDNLHAVESRSSIQVHDLAIDLLHLADQLNEEIALELRRKGISSIKPTWAITLYRMGDSAWRGVDLSQIWLGVDNISYPIKKMASLGFINVKKDQHDGRSSSIKRTEKGGCVASIVGDVLKQQSELIIQKAQKAASDSYKKNTISIMSLYLSAASGCSFNQHY